MDLKLMPMTYVKAVNKKEWASLLKLCQMSGWEWWSGQKAVNKYAINRIEKYGGCLWLDVSTSNLSYITSPIFKNRNLFTMLNFNEFLEAQGLKDVTVEKIDSMFKIFG